jgi:hypothetical protein
MLLHDIDARDNHPVFIRVAVHSATLAIHLPTTDDPMHGAFCSALFTAQDYDGITFPYLHRYLLTYNSTHIAYRVTDEQRRTTERAQQMSDRH